MKYARSLGGLLDSLDGTDEMKLSLDILKEAGRHLEGPRPADRADAPAVVHLIHNVPRPTRATPSSPPP
jgi:hypothetical protein